MTEEPGRIQSLGLERVRHNLVTEEPQRREKRQFFFQYTMRSFSAPELLGDAGRGRRLHSATTAGLAVTGVFIVCCALRLSCCSELRCH